MNESVQAVGDLLAGFLDLDVDEGRRSPVSHASAARWSLSRPSATTASVLRIPSRLMVHVSILQASRQAARILDWSVTGQPLTLWGSMTAPPRRSGGTPNPASFTGWVVVRVRRVLLPAFRLAHNCASIVSMADQETLLERKKRGPKPTGKGQQVVVRCQPDLLAAVDAFRSTFSPIINRPAALRRIATEFLSRRGFLAK
jgi:hypothetical protein